jgi:sugar phosphate isomerase/epimerase
MKTIRKPGWIFLFGALCLFAGTLWASLKPSGPRQSLNLDGLWQVAEGGLDSPPAEYGHAVPVPGLVDMATPAFREVGKKSPLRQAFWYRRTFKVAGGLPAAALLKIHKARYGTRVFLNGRLIGDHLPCFTPAYLEAREALKGNGQENELVIRVGADRESLPQDMPTGWDFEKYLYLPGIYDSVELILTGLPRVVNVQTVPDLDAGVVRVLAEVETVPGGPVQVRGQVFAADGAAASEPCQAGISPADSRQVQTVDFNVPIRHCRWWSPEDPYLYTLRVGTGADEVQLRFGMRSFRFDAPTGRAVLNGKPYFLRGSNVTLYRFFEDSERRDRPWRAEWVRRLHQQFQAMHWNSLRYCIGFPPEFWYDIADELGFLIQDEFPIWLLGGAPEKPVAAKIIPEYTEWMRERWNHPCVVIWDAQNESNTAETGKSIQAVRHLDLSGRPWENGWAEPQCVADCVESHPYQFIRIWQGGTFHMREMAHLSGVPNLSAAQKKLAVPVIINEYGWLWLTRDGQPTCLTDKVYEKLLGPNSTVDQRRQVFAKYLAAKTEFWRCHRECAGVLHFCGLGYSRPGDKPRPEGGATSDHFTDLEQLAFEPHFQNYVGDAFNPVGLMLNFWEEEMPAGWERKCQVFVINDRYLDWQGQVSLKLVRDGRAQVLQSQACTVPALGREILDFKIKFPAETGAYTLVAELNDAARSVRSQRDFKITRLERAACSTLCQLKQPTEKAFQAIAGAGFKWLDLSCLSWAPHVNAAKLAADFEPEAIRVERALDASGLRVANLTFDAIETLPFEKYEAQFRALVQLAARLEARLINLMAPSAKCDRADQVAKLRKLQQIAREGGVILTAETHCNQITEWPADAVQLCQEVPGLKLTLDPSHYFAGPNQGASFDQIYPLVEGTGLRAGGRDWNSIQLAWGEGPIDFAEVIRKLKAAGYRGFFAVEYLEGHNQVDALAQSRRFLEWYRKSGLNE